MSSICHATIEGQLDTAIAELFNACYNLIMSKTENMQKDLNLQRRRTEIVRVS